VTTAIVIAALGLLGIGIVINQLLRLKRWLKNAPPPSEAPDENPAEPPEAN
jgi:hypothetical protein